MHVYVNGKFYVLTLDRELLEFDPKSGFVHYGYTITDTLANIDPKKTTLSTDGHYLVLETGEEVYRSSLRGGPFWERANENAGTWERVQQRRVYSVRKTA